MSDFPPTDGPILQAAAVPFRGAGRELQLCLITSMRSGKWGFPKGIIDPGETPIETALKEAEEEAGLHGCIVGTSFGPYEYGKWGTTLLVTGLLMQVDAVDADWPEAEMRTRRWATPEQARQLITRPWLRDLLDTAAAQLASLDARPRQ